MNEAANSRIVHMPFTPIECVKERIKFYVQIDELL